MFDHRMCTETSIHSLTGIGQSRHDFIKSQCEGEILESLSSSESFKGMRLQTSQRV